MKNNFIISSKDNKLYKYLKLLMNKKTRKKEEVFFVEGFKVIEESLNYHKPLFIVMSDLFDLEKKELILNKIGDDKIKIFLVKDFLFKKLSDTENSQGIIAYFKNIHLNGVDKINKGRYVFFDDLQDPGNVGGLIRSADAFNLDGVILSPKTVELYNPKLLRSTMTSIFRIPVYVLDSKKEILKLKEKEFKIISTALENSKSSYKFDFTDKLVLVLGNESGGISDEIFSYSDVRLNIPINKFVNSLNVNVAGSILFYEMNR